MRPESVQVPEPDLGLSEPQAMLADVERSQRGVEACENSG